MTNLTRSWRKSTAVRQAAAEKARISVNDLGVEATDNPMRRPPAVSLIKEPFGLAFKALRNADMPPRKSPTLTASHLPGNGEDTEDESAINNAVRRQAHLSPPAALTICIQEANTSRTPNEQISRQGMGDNPNTRMRNASTSNETGP
jgi:hypothetical protein